MKLHELNQRAVDLMKKVKVRVEKPEEVKARHAHSRKAIASNLAAGHITQAQHDKQMKAHIGEAKEEILRGGPGFPDVPKSRSGNIHKYVIASSDYMGMEPDMAEFQGTFRDLLVYLNFGDELDDETKMEASSHSDQELIKFFDEANGDGQPYYMVYDAVEHKKVLG